MVIVSVKMAFTKYFSRHNHRRLRFSLYQVISTICLLSLVGIAMTVAGEGQEVTLQRKISSNNALLPLYANPPSIKIEPKASPSVRDLTVTKGSSRARTTSTVRPWPSHNFFRSVLSNSDNVAGASRPNFALTDHNETGLQDKGASTHLKRLAKSRKRNKNRVRDDIVQARAPIQRYDAGRRSPKEGIKNFNETEGLLKNSVPSLEIVTQASGNLDKARSSMGMAISTKNNSVNNAANSDRKLKNAIMSQEKLDVQIHPQFENAFSSRDIQTTSNESKRLDEYSHMNGPQVGFQYEIEAPPPSLPSRPSLVSSSSLSASSYNVSDFMSKSLLYIPSTTAVSTTLRVSLDSSGKSNKSDTSLPISTSAVSTMSATDAFERATTSSALYNGMKGVETTSTKPPRVPTTHSFFFHNQTHKSNENPSHHHFAPLPRTPTHMPQLNVYSSGKYSFQRPIPQKYPAQGGNEIHKIKGMEELSSSLSSVKINHNFGNFAAVTPPAREFTTVVPFLSPTLERNREGNSSSANGLTLKIAERNGTSVQHQQQYHDPTFHPWDKSQPTHFPHKMTVENTSTFHSKGDAPIYNQKNSRRGSQTSSTLIKRKNMFTVVNKAKKEPSMYVESRNGTHKHNKNPVKQGYLLATNFHDRTNQVERPPQITTAILAGPDRTGSNYVNVEGKDNDYFDEDDAQIKLHHWIETEQGHSISGSTELPRFTNLTWPYYFDGNGSSVSSFKSTLNSTFQGGVITGSGSDGNSGNSASPSTALAVSFNSQQGKEKLPSTGFNSRYEFYIPSAAADPHQNPILVAKPSTPDKTEVPLDSWSLVSTLESFTTDSHHPSPLKNGLSHLNQGESDSKTKVKHSHWGSKGLSSIKQEKPQSKQPLFPSSPPPPVPEKKRRPNRPQENIKVYESSTGIPKSTPTSYLQNLPISSFSTFAGGKHENHFSTFHIPTPSATWPILGGIAPGAGDQTEMASFVTAKTPTNIWYKPIINHFTATVPINGTTMFYDNLFAKSSKNPVAPYTTTPMPFISSTLISEYVGEDEHDSGNKKDKTFYPSHSSNEHSPPVLFNVWKLVDGKLTLQSQKKISSWAMEGYPIPATGTLLNLQQIPPAVQPLVTSAMGKEAEAYGNTKVYVWQRLPLIGSPATTSNVPLEPLPGNERNPQKIISSIGNSGWSSNDGGDKRPISINYVLWNNPGWASNSQSIILSTSPQPPHQFILSHQPTPVSYFPTSTISTLEDEYQQPTTPFPMMVTVKRPHQNSYLTSNFPPTTSTTIRPNAATVSNEELELLFQNYFQYISMTTTTTTPATHVSTTKAIGKEPFFGESGSNKDDMTNSMAWSDLKKLILRLAANNNRKKMGDKSNKTSITPEDKPDYLDTVGNVAAISVIMNYLQRQEESKDSVFPPISQQQAFSLPIRTTTTKPPSSSLAPYGVTDDMTPPHKDQLWATTYPLFQHMLNNPNYTFIPPPTKPLPSNPLSLANFLSSSSSPTQFSTPIPFTEPPTGNEGTTLSSNMNEYYTKFNHYASYPTGPASSITRAPYTIGSQVYITEIPKHGATTEKIPRSDIDKLGEWGYGDDPAKTLLLPIPPPNLLQLLILSKLLHKKKGGGGWGWGKGGGKSKKKKKLATVGAAAAAGAAGATLLKKIAHVVKQPSKYWLDLKFDIDFYDLIKKQFLYWLAYRYMPVFIVLAFGLIPLSLSLVPLLYKTWWHRYKKPKYIKVPVPIPKPYPVPVYKHPEPPTHPYPHYPDTHYGYDNHDHGQFHGYSPPDDEHSLHNPDPDLPYEHEAHDQDDHHDQHNHDEEDEVIHIDSRLPSSPLELDHYHAGDSTGKDDGQGFGEAQDEHSPHSYKTRPNGHKDDYRKRKVNSFNYNEDHNPSHSTSYSHSKDAFYRYPPAYNNGKPGEEDQEIHVHLHDEETHQVPQYQRYHQKAPVTFPPSFKYTSYSSKDLQPYPATKSYEMGFDLGQILSKITNKQDVEIFKILIENKKEQINQLLEMWKLAKYGVGVASSAATNFAGNLAAAGAAVAGGGNEVVTTPLYSPKGKYGKRGRRRGKRRKKWKPKPANDKDDNINDNSKHN